MRRWNCHPLRGGCGDMDHCWENWGVGTLPTASEQGFVFLLKSRRKMGEKFDVSTLLFHFGTSSCIQVKEWGKKSNNYSQAPGTQTMEFVPFPVPISRLLSQFLPAGPDKTVRTG